MADTLIVQSITAYKTDDYRQGLRDAIAEIDAEMTYVDMEYGDAPSCAMAARRVLSNAKQLILDKLAIEGTSHVVA